MQRPQEIKSVLSQIEYANGKKTQVGRGWRQKAVQDGQVCYMLKAKGVSVKLQNKNNK